MTATKTNEKNNVPILLRDKNQKLRILTKESIHQYIDAICKKTGTKYLDINKLVNNIYPKLKQVNTMKELDEQIVSCSTEMIVDHYDYPTIGVWILVNELHKNTSDDYLMVCEKLYNNVNKKGKHSPIISEEYYQFIKKYHREINAALHYERDYQLSIFGLRTLEKAYLKREVNGRLIERPQHMFMRVAICLHYRENRLDRIFESYELMSQGFFTHATPTLFNAGTKREQLSSCFLLGIDDDMEAIGECWKDCAVLSKYAGGLGINVSNIRSNGAYIDSTQGTASGMKLLTVFNQIARYADQGGKRAGSIAIYLEPWHADIYFFLDLKKHTGAETERARDLFLGLMINDVFMKRVENDEVWSLMCPCDCPNILNKYGKEFEEAYVQYEKEKKFIKQIRAQDLWFKIMEIQIESGVPYIVFKDAINEKSNQKHLGVINGSNLCCEIALISTAHEYSVCTLSSICLPKFCKEVNGKMEFDYQKLYQVSRVVCRNLDNIIDLNYYPVKKTRISNFKHRPIGIGVQGLADVFALFKTPFGSPLARELNKKIFETIYFGAMTESVEMAKEKGAYSSFPGSPLSQGIFQFQMWGVNENQLSGMWDWSGLREKLFKYGARNSEVTTCMPTASTAQILNNNEACEPYTENIYTRSTLAGDYYVINRHLMKDLMELGLWNQDMIDFIKYYEGSIAQIPTIPNNIKEIYRTAWEIPQKHIVEMDADRAIFITMTQSSNRFIAKPTFALINSVLFYAWRKGLKTGMYYLRSKAPTGANQFGIDIDKIKEIESKKKKKMEELPCKFIPKHLLKPGDCMVCSA